jgi:hypothetical protein
MPKDLRVNAAQAYKEQPVIQIGYSIRRGGDGTVRAIVRAQPILIAQARISTSKLNLFDCQSSLIHEKVLYSASFINSSL